MKVLVRKPKDDPDVWEVFEQSSWLKWMDSETGAPLSSPGGGYSKPVEVPDEYAGKLKAEDFDVTEKVIKGVDDVTGEETEYTEITAVFDESRCKERIANDRTYDEQDQ